MNIVWSCVTACSVVLFTLPWLLSRIYLSFNTMSGKESHLAADAFISNIKCHKKLKRTY